MLAYDETAARAGQASIIVANIPTAHVSVVANGFSKLIANGIS
jgi:hypothetical protein